MFSSGFVKGWWQPVLLLLSLPAAAQLNPGDAGVSKITVTLKGEKLIPDSQAVSMIYQKNNELFASGDIFLYTLSGSGEPSTNQTAFKRMSVVRSLLMENGIPDSSIRFHLVGTKTGKIPFALQPDAVLICYRLPADFNKFFSAKYENPLCLNDTLVPLMNGVLLQYRLCDFLEITVLPVVETKEEMINEEMRGSNAAVAGNLQELLYRFRYMPNQPGRRSDQLLFSVPANTMAHQLKVEWYDDSLGSWNAHRRFSVVKNVKGTFCAVYFPMQGYGRISRINSAGIVKLYIAAPEGMAFRKAALKNDDGVVYQGTLANGGTAALFLLPEPYASLSVDFTFIRYDNKLFYAAPGRLEKMLGRKFPIPEKFRKSVLIDGQKISMPEDGFRFEGETDGVRTVNVTDN
ncbi:MAG: hypothetical protein U0Y08_15280 [Bacteroidia bacterium]